MAGLAFLPALGVVDILQPVAGNTGGWQILVDFRGMAQRAANFFVGVNKWKFRFFVIEGFCTVPIAHAVTGFAFLTKMAFMRLVLLMAFGTGVWCISEFGFRLVTSAACNRLVRASQRKVSKMMVECVRIEQSRVGVPANVIRVAMLAFSLGNVLAQTVKAGNLLHVGIDFVMAITAQA